MEDSYARGNTSLKPDLLSYNTVLDAFSKEGDAKSAERLLEQMLDKDDGVIKPDSHSYTSVRPLIRATISVCRI
jgi:pentatricopeptide repeat protein